MTTDNKCKTCSDTECTAQQKKPGERDEDYLDRQALSSRMCQIQHKIMVLSGKGGVGKSTVAVNLAAALAMAGKRVGLLDVDIHGPSIPKLLHVEGTPISGSGDGLYPVKVVYRSGILNVMSIGFLLREKDDAVIWRGPRKYSLIKQFLKDVEWGALDYLVIDSPPGTGDEPLAIAQLIENADGAVVVTTPQDVAVQDVRRCIVFCRQLDLPVLGVLENMSGFTCPGCGEHIRLFGAGGGRTMADEMGVPFLGAIPIDPEVVSSGDSGKPMVQANPHSETAKAFNRIIRKFLEPELSTASAPSLLRREGQGMKIAVPVTDGVLSSHFGHCEQFALFDVDADSKTIRNRQTLMPPAHEPGILPRWLHEQGANVIISRGMGSRAQSLFFQNDIQVVVGVLGDEPDAIVKSFLEGRLEAGANICDH
jgi:Mrp family chromosome partitioning ATPase/predicted Fe-Mo cluster-binding NifX family protein